MLTREAQDRLTRVGRGTPMGELLRRYWFPVAASSEVSEGSALEVMLLGESLALFRSPSGEVGLPRAPLSTPRRVTGSRNSRR